MTRFQTWAERPLATLLLVVTLTAMACQGPAAGPTGQQVGGQGSGQSAAGQELRFNLASEPPGLDPQYSAWDASIAVLLSTFDGLLRFDENLKVRPAVAREVPTLDNGGISRDAKTYTFKLRNDVKWSDGQPLTARDFDYGIRRLFDPDKGAEYADFYFGIVGGKEYFTAKGTKEAPKNPSASELQALRDRIGVRVVDDYTLEVQLTEPRASFLQLAALWPMYPIRKDVVDKFGDRWTDAGNMVSNGPFKLTEWAPNDHLTLTPNEFYYGTKAKLSKLTLRVITDSNAEFAAYQNGELDGARVPTASVQQVLNDDRYKAEIKRGPRLSTFALQFNLKRPPFDNKLVRQAFSQAVDRETFVRQVRQGIGKAAYSWVPPGMPGYQEALGKDVNKFDPAAAKKLLSDAGYPNGQGLPPTSFQFANTRDNPLRAQFFQGQLKDHLGIEIALEPMETAAFSRLVSSNQHHIANAGWNADYPDADNWLPGLFGTGAGNNHSQYSNPQLDDLMTRATSEPDDGKRLQMWAQAQEIVVKDVPMVFLFNDEAFFLFKPYVQGLKLSGMDGSALPGQYFMSEVSIQK